MFLRCEKVRLNSGSLKAGLACWRGGTGWLQLSDNLTLSTNSSALWWICKESSSNLQQSTPKVKWMCMSYQLLWEGIAFGLELVTARRRNQDLFVLML